MPLVVMCGYPCSGKSKRAEELKNYLENSSGKTVHLAGDESLNLERNTVYAGNLKCTLRAESPSIFLEKPGKVEGGLGSTRRLTEMHLPSVYEVVFI